MGIKCGSPWRFSTWDLLSFLDLWIKCFSSDLRSRGQLFLQIYLFALSLLLLGFFFTCVDILNVDVVSEALFIFFQSIFSIFRYIKFYWSKLRFTTSITHQLQYTIELTQSFFFQLFYFSTLRFSFGFVPSISLLAFSIFLFQDFFSNF